MPRVSQQEKERYCEEIRTFSVEADAGRDKLGLAVGLARQRALSWGGNALYIATIRARQANEPVSLIGQAVRCDLEFLRGRQRAS